MIDWQWVDNDNDFALLCEQWAECSVIGLDTEFIRERTFLPISALLQVNDGRQLYLVDVLSIGDFSPLAALLANADVVKVLHSCSEDLEVFQCLCGEIPAPLFDTQVAAAFVNLGASLGYASLCRELLGVELEKGETRSDWLQRPLSSKQMHYAALDVEHLLLLRERLVADLDAAGLTVWFAEECAQIVARSRQREDISQAYLRVKGAWRLASKYLPALQMFTRWREHEVRARNMPRAHLMKDEVLLNLAESIDVGDWHLSRVKGVSPNVAKRYHNELTGIKETANAQAGKISLPRLPKPLTQSQSKRLKALRQHLTLQADRYGMCPDLLTAKRDLEPLIRAWGASNRIDLSGVASQWRRKLYAEALSEMGIEAFGY